VTIKRNFTTINDKIYFLAKLSFILVYCQVILRVYRKFLTIQSDLANNISS